MLWCVLGAVACTAGSTNEIDAGTLRDAAQVADVGPGVDVGQIADAAEIVDAGGVPEAGPMPDSGRRPVCPSDPNPECAQASQCMPDNSRQSNCAGCRAYNHALCVDGTCLSPPRLGSGDIINLMFAVGSLYPRLKSFAGHVIASATAGGDRLTCRDLYDSRVSVDEHCYNIIDSRGRGTIGAMGDVYPFAFSGFASGQRVLFIVYGYEMENSEGDPIGVSCTERDVGAPGDGPQNVAGDMMRRFQ